ncbi:uncharacterized protein LOC116205643 [Punica granatum]|uniref:Uncharacterized protein LOC116205643 n=1 Tax=Punica granatum TaxID=22663 RepID=A0A6P8DQA1_PUNGR|nr:uncharacterized protein LOC116205643 [Punica granatum]
MPYTLIFENGTQFDSMAFKEFCKALNIEQKFSTVAHPPSNGQTDVSNRTLLRELRCDKGQETLLFGIKVSNIVERESIINTYVFNIDGEYAHHHFAICITNPINDVVREDGEPQQLSSDFGVAQVDHFSNILVRGKFKTLPYSLNICCDIFASRAYGAAWNCTINSLKGLGSLIPFTLEIHHFF